MLGQWRMVLRQAEEAARAGRYDEALLLASRPDVADHHHAVRLRSRLALDLVSRASRRGEADDLNGAIDDLDLAERHGAAPDVLAAARLNLGDRVAGEVKQSLEVGDPDRVVERVEALAKHKIGGPTLRRIRDAAEAWSLAICEARRGEFGRAHQALDRADLLAAGLAVIALTALRSELEARRKGVAPRIEALYAILSDGQWGPILSAADAVLELVPEHPAARQARQRAWQQIAAIGPGAMAWPDRGSRFAKVSIENRVAAVEKDNKFRVAPSPKARPVVADAILTTPTAKAIQPSSESRCLLWVDTVGGYLVCFDPTIILGRAGVDSPADVPLLGDVSRQHATLTREGDGYLLRANHPTFVNGRQVDATSLRDGDVIRLGSSLEMEFRQPSPVSATARLSIVSRHRMPLAVDSIILMAETCILGSNSQAHIPISNLSDAMVLYRQGTTLWCRSSGRFEVDGKPVSGRAPLSLKSSVLGDGVSFSLEPLGTGSRTI